MLNKNAKIFTKNLHLCTVCPIFAAEIKNETDKGERMVSIKRPLLRYHMSETSLRRKTLQKFA